MVIGSPDDAVNAIACLKLYVESNMKSFNKKDFVECMADLAMVDYFIVSTLIIKNNA